MIVYVMCQCDIWFGETLTHTSSPFQVLHQTQTALRDLELVVLEVTLDFDACESGGNLVVDEEGSERVGNLIRSDILRVLNDPFPGMAEREGFEPPGGCPPTVFKTAAFVHSATSPNLIFTASQA